MAKRSNDEAHPNRHDGDSAWTALIGTRTVVESEQSSGTRFASDSLALIGIKAELIDAR